MSEDQNLSFFKLDSNTVLKPFESKDKDLNEFFVEKAKPYQEELLAVTHIIENDVKTLAYFSIFNDSLKVEKAKFASKSKFKKFMSEFVSHPKRHLQSFPALKIGRLAVCKEEKGYGRIVVNWIINYAIEVNRDCACKFITVDAYSESLGFYEKMNFNYISENDIGEDTRQMYLDLTPYLNAVEAENK